MSVPASQLKRRGGRRRDEQQPREREQRNESPWHGRAWWATSSSEHRILVKHPALEIFE
jgi:hypothetical protein